MRSRSIVAVVLLAVSGACGDIPTASLSFPNDTATTSRTLRELGDRQNRWQHWKASSVPYTCTVAAVDERGSFQSRHATIRFASAEQHPEGARRSYLYRGYSGTDLVLVARCVIPATEAAARRMDRAFRVGRGGEDTGSFTTMGCVPADKGCTLAPVVVTACVGGATYPACDDGVEADHDICSDFGGCGGGGGWSWSGGSSGGGGGVTTSSDGGPACPTCNPRAPTEPEEKDMERQLQTVLCADVRATLQSMLPSMIRVYTADDGRWGSYDSETGIIYVSRSKHWLSTGLDEAELADTLVHEVVHRLMGHYNGQPHGEAHAQDFRDRMAMCGFPQ